LPNPPTVALIGSETLLAREVRDIVATTSPDLTLRLVAAAVLDAAQGDPGSELQFLPRSLQHALV